MTPNPTPASIDAPAAPLPATTCMSILIPTYNRADLLRQTLDSIFASTFTDFEVLIVDDGSTDTTDALVRQYADRHPNIRYIKQQNAGPGPARNLGFRLARGQYIVFLDSDDLCFPWTLSTLKEVIDRHNAPAMISVRARHFSDPAQLASETHAPIFADAYPHFFASPRRWFVPSGTAVKTDVLRAAGGCAEDLRVGEDIDLWLRIGSSPGYVDIHDPVCCGYREHAGSISRGFLLRLHGIEYILDKEKKNAYPGGRDVKRLRADFITTHTRAASKICLVCGLLKRGMRLYLRTFAWNLRTLRLRYLLGYPVFSFGHFVRKHTIGTKEPDLS